VHHCSLFRLFSVELCSYSRSSLKHSLLFVSHASLCYVVSARYLLCSLCRFFFVVSCSVVCSVLCLSVGISFCSEVSPVLGWRASGMNSWKGRVLSSGGLWGWGFMVGGV